MAGLGSRELNSVATNTRVLDRPSSSASHILDPSLGRANRQLATSNQMQEMTLKACSWTADTLDADILFMHTGSMSSLCVGQNVCMHEACQFSE